MLDWLEVGLGGLLFLDAHGEIEFSCVIARPSQAAQCVSIVLCVPVCMYVCVCVCVCVCARAHVLSGRSAGPGLEYQICSR